VEVSLMTPIGRPARRRLDWPKAVTLILLALGCLAFWVWVITEMPW
jgi:hypothetical protein